jgi:hypothetical protein
MTNITIFKNGTVATSGRREPTELGKSLSANSTTRRIQTNTNGTFKRIINGEQVGNAVRGELDVIIVHALPDVSRVYYRGKYDPNAKPTLPDCWSNLGKAPEKEASNKQSRDCQSCPQNVKGSGDNGGRACRYQRRLAVLVVGDPSGDIYQFNVPAKSLFGKGNGNVHPFESYVKFLLANGESPDTVVTNISYDLNADSMQLLFTPMRNISDEEYELLVEAQASPEAKAYTMLTVAQADGVTAKPAMLAAPKAAPVVTRSNEPDDEEEDAPPAKRVTTKKAATTTVAAKEDLASIIDAWGAVEDEE